MNHAETSPDWKPLHGRLLELWERTGDENLHRLALGKTPHGHREPETSQERLDLISSCLMNCYRNTGDGQVFAMLFDQNRQSFLQAIQARIRRNASPIDPQDVLQEVFLNIYRYPRRFLCERADSFRNWGHRIVRNTMLKFFKGENRLSKFTPLDEDVGQRPDHRAATPFRSVQESESADLVDFAYLVYLNLYLTQYRRLSEKEQTALRMVEIEGASYKATAAELGLRLENLKMVIFRGRRKIYRGLQKTLAELTAPSEATPAPARTVRVPARQAQRHAVESAAG